MNSIFINLTIDGIKISGDDLRAYASRQIKDENIPGWKQDVFRFVHEWLNDDAFIETPTSGSTGKPKTIRLKKEWMVNSAKYTNAYFGINESTQALLCLPAKYIAGKMMIVRAFVGECNLILTAPSSNPFETVTGSIDFSAITPFQLFKSLETIKIRQNIRTLIVGGGDISGGLIEAIQGTSIEVFATYGMTETCSHIAIRKLNGKNKASDFKVFENIKILKDERDCLVIHAPLLNDAQLTTNDVVDITDDKHFKWLGRWDNVINSGGIKIFPEQVEKKISGLLPERMIIIPIPDEQLGNVPVLVIESENISMLEKENLLSRISLKVDKYFVPRQVFNVPVFPETATGKPDRNRIVDIVAKNL